MNLGMTDERGDKAVRVRVEGRVQGVAFRYWTVHEATARGLNGWVRNRGDGSVEALFSGPGAMVDEMLEACRQGPPAALVTEVTFSPSEERPQTGFRQISMV